MGVPPLDRGSPFLTQHGDKGSNPAAGGTGESPLFCEEQMKYFIPLILLFATSVASAQDLPTDFRLIWFKAAIAANDASYAEAAERRSQDVVHGVQFTRDGFYQRTWITRQYGGGPVTIINPFVPPTTPDACLNGRCPIKRRGTPTPAELPKVVPPSSDLPVPHLRKQTRSVPPSSWDVFTLTEKPTLKPLRVPDGAPLPPVTNGIFDGLVEPGNAECNPPKPCLGR